jgi:hypothetical protein
MKNKIQLFQDKKIRTHWDENKELWYFSVIDIIAVLTKSPRPRKYWNALKIKLEDEGSQTVTICNRLKMKATNGKKAIV